MSTSTHTTEFFDTLAKVLLRSWIFGFLLLLIWFGVFLLARGLIHDLHGTMFDLSPHELNVIFYCGIAFVKVCVLVFFFFPWLSIRLVLRKQHGSM